MISKASCYFMFCDFSPSRKIVLPYSFIGRKYFKSLNVVRFCLQEHPLVLSSYYERQLPGPCIKGLWIWECRGFNIFHSYGVYFQREWGVCILTFALYFNITWLNVLHREGRPCKAGSISCCQVSCRQLFPLIWVHRWGFIKSLNV